MNTLLLFKSFATALRSSDSSLLILPYAASKQHYTPLATLKQIQTMESNQMYQYFKSLYHRQLYSLSGFFHISSQLPFSKILTLPKVQEWLDSNSYFIKLCPSQDEEMIPLGALCYSNVLMHREDFKEAIYQHPLWKIHFPKESPIFDLYLDDFLATGKKEKMLFVSGEKSKQEEIMEFFKAIYNGDSKQYPNASMMLFIPFIKGTHMAQQYRDKIIFNHQQYNGQGKVLAVGGLSDLQTEVTFKTGQKISLRSLIKSIPSTTGMNHPLLFQHFEANSSKSIHMAIFQKEDTEYVLARKNTLEADLRQLIALEDINKIFLNPKEGLWFGNVQQKKGISSQNCTADKNRTRICQSCQ